jgi:phosphoribosylformimino-5-aminoimidazole carboxamide ribotide isomerase
MDSHGRSGSARFVVVPVIDVRAGQVVHARRGERERYRPLNSGIAHSAAPEDVVDGLLALYPFRTLYIADLDGIGGREPQIALLRSLRRRAVNAELWIDAGVASLPLLRSIVEIGTPVLGTESLTADGADAILNRAPDAVLSVDFRGARFLGPPDLLASPRRWPRRLIAMNLEQVGSGAGPDLELLARLRGAAPQGEIYAAGGVRDAQDLRTVAAAGARGALVATCLHERRLDRAQIEAIEGE